MTFSRQTELERTGNSSSCSSSEEGALLPATLARLQQAGHAPSLWEASQAYNTALLATANGRVKRRCRIDGMKGTGRKACILFGTLWRFAGFGGALRSLEFYPQLATKDLQTVKCMARGSCLLDCAEVDDGRPREGSCGRYAQA